MQLNRSIEDSREAWIASGYELPSFTRQKVIDATEQSPEWVHFGAGNIFRAFQANIVQKLLNLGVMKTGLIAVEGYDPEIISKMYEPHDNYSILVTLKPDGTIGKTVIGSIVKALEADEKNREDFTQLKSIFRSDSLKMASFTITEKGYSLYDGKQHLLSAVEDDFMKGPDGHKSYMGKVTSLIYERYQSGKKPLALVSMDNCSHNGDKLYAAVNEFANEWVKRGHVPAGFVDYVNDRTQITFPWTMIDKITPRPDEEVRRLLMKDGIEEMNPAVTMKNTYLAPYVNAEEPEYLVIEDAFPNGRLPLEQAGVIYTDRSTVEKVEKMKVCTCLNPLHTALAVFGCLLGYQRISKEMENPLLRKLAERIGWKEGLPVVTDPKIIQPEKFLREVLEERIPNPFMPDTPQRIATDTSQKISIRFGETIKAYQRTEGLDVSELIGIPLVIAGWFRYLCGVDDLGKPIQLSSDPLMKELQHTLAGVEYGKPETVGNQLKSLLSDSRLFGCNLYEAGLGEKIEHFFAQMLTGPGAVVKTLAAALR